MVEQRGIENAVLCSLYEAYFLEDAPVLVPGLVENRGWDMDATWKRVARLAHDGLVISTHFGGFYRITCDGILYVEMHSIDPGELIQKNQQARAMILDSLATFYEREKPLAHADLGWLCEQTGLETEPVQRNLQVLNDLGHVNWITNDSLRITHEGLDAIEEWRQRLGIAEHFERVEQMKPHPRGRAFQKWFAMVAEQHGWSQEEGARTSYEEMDVVVFRGREYYLVECKWEKHPVRSGVVRELYGKIENRVGVRGIVASMSGFTKGAAKQVRKYSGRRVILLLGPDDVCSMAYGQATFDELLNEKFHELVVREKVIWR